MLVFLVSLMITLPFEKPPQPTIRTGEFGDYDASQVLMASDGSLFLLSYDDFKIQKLSAGGQKLAHFGGKGQGPGEFNYPYQMFSDENRFYVWDFMEDHMVIFDMEGHFLENMRAPRSGLDIKKVHDGWVYGTWRTAQDSKPEEEVQLFMANERFSQPRLLASAKGNGYGGRFIAMDEHSIYTPVHPVPILKVDMTHERIYLVDSHELDVAIFDARSGASIGHIHRQMPTYPFNSEWADIRLNEVKTQMPNRKFKTNYLEKFPVVRQLHIAPNGILVFRLFTADPGQTDKVLALSQDGGKVEFELSWREWMRWVAVQGENALIICQDYETKEYLLKWIATTDLVDVLKREPLADDGEP